MKHLYHNPYEVPETIRLTSSCFGIEVEYHPWDSGDKPVNMDDLFTLAKSNCFDVEVFLTSHNDAYVKTSKKATVGTAVEGWVNLARFDSINGYLEDRYHPQIAPPTSSKDSVKKFIYSLPTDEADE